MKNILWPVALVGVAAVLGTAVWLEPETSTEPTVPPSFAPRIQYRAWSDLTEEERLQARQNFILYNALGPEDRSKLHARYEWWRKLPSEERTRLREARSGARNVETPPRPLASSGVVPAISSEGPSGGGTVAASGHEDGHPDRGGPPSSIAR